MRAVRRLLALFLGLGLVVAGCGTGPGAEKWATEVCAALKPWQTEIDELTAEANTAMKPDSSPTQAKRDLLKLLEGAADSSEDARAAIAAAGVPDVAEGGELAERFTESLAATRDAYRTAHDGIAELDAGASGFYDEVAKVMERLAKDYDAVPQVASLDSDELRDAFASVKRCQ